MARFGLPDVDFIEVDPEEMESIAVARFENATGTTLDEEDPRRKFIQSIVFLASMLTNNIDFTGKMNLLAFSVDNYLEHLGVKKGVPRLEPRAAETVIRFECNPVEAFTIPSGTRMSVADLEFASTADYLVTVGMTTIDVPVTCTELGTVGNGYLPNQITSIVDNDNLPWVTKAYNITKTDGGLDWEEDDPYADRIRQSNAQYSTAGPEDAYIYHAKSVSSEIVDVAVYSPSESVVAVVPLLENGELPTKDILNAIEEKLNGRTIRPLTDMIRTELPEIVRYDIQVNFYIPRSKSSVETTIKAQINAAIDDYIKWQKSKLGRGIDASELVTRIKEAGGIRVTASSPSQFIVLSKTQVAHANAVSANYGGLVDD
ncbi:baseplate J/gp47 family protein [Niallia taxi]|uniref:baseplate assembly protein n=1 Tax=Niallia taxi TaxID=2499688 RepID=UPI00398236B9